MVIGRGFRRGSTAIYRCFSVCHLIGLQGRTVAVFPSDGIFAFGLVVISNVCLRALHFGEGCRCPSCERIGPFCILFARISPSIRRGLTVFQLQIVEHGLTIIIYKRNLVFLCGLIELRDIGLVALHLRKAVAACALESPASKLKRERTIVWLVRIFRLRSHRSQIGRIRRRAVIYHFCRSQYRHIIIKERDRVLARGSRILRGISSRTGYLCNGRRPCTIELVCIVNGRILSRRSFVRRRCARSPVTRIKDSTIRVLERNVVLVVFLVEVRCEGRILCHNRKFFVINNFRTTTLCPTIPSPNIVGGRRCLGRCST